MSQYGDQETRVTSGVGRTKQSMRDECNVNLIVANFTKTGFLGHLAQGVPEFVDVSEMTDYRSVIEQVRSVEKYFAGLPAEVRTAFGNDAVDFMQYLETASVEDLETLGLEALGDRRGRSQDAREGDVDPAPEVSPEPDGTLST